MEGGRGDTDRVGTGSEQSQGWVNPGAAGARGMAGRRPHVLGLLVKNRPPPPKQTVLDKELSLHRGFCCSESIAAAPGAVASLLVAPQGGKTRPTTSNSSGIGLVPPSPQYRSRLPFPSGCAA